MSEIKVLVHDKMRLLFYGDPDNDKNIKKIVHIFHKVALFLYPPTKNLHWMQDVEKADVMKYVTDFMKQINAESSSNVVNTVTSEPPDIFKKFMQTRNVSVISTDEEINRYISSTDFQPDIIQFWESNKTVYPRIYKLFLKLICVPATSAASERAFSKAGYIFSSRRSQLSYSNLNNMAVLSSNFACDKKEIKDCPMDHIVLD